MVTSSVAINEHCVGERWETINIDQLARLIAIIAMGQVTQAANIVKELNSALPAFTDKDLTKEATVRLSVQETKQGPRIGFPRTQRDGFIFQAISWIAARQSYGKDVLLKDPHTSATSQGIDGLMIELDPDHSSIISTVIFEDKCTEQPRATFKSNVLPSFLERHENRRNAELVATAGSLLRACGLNDSDSAAFSAAVTKRNLRKYRAAFALCSEFDVDEKRKALFKDYETLTEITSQQRIGASFIVSSNLREWFDELANRAIKYLAVWGEGKD